MLHTIDIQSSMSFAPESCHRELKDNLIASLEKLLVSTKWKTLFNKYLIQSVVDLVVIGSATQVSALKKLFLFI